MLSSQSPSELFGYQILEVLHRGERSDVYRALAGAERVIIKVPRDRSSASHRATLNRELELLQRLDGVVGVVEPVRLVGGRDECGLVFHDTAGQSLRRLGLCGTLSIPRFLGLAAALAKILEQVHRRGVIHRDLHPGNIVLDGSEELRLIDFSNATLLERYVAPLAGAGLRTSALPYQSPEQTGRMNRAVDYRTDYYSLGVVFFELLTGTPPFNSDDPLELVHAHVARLPPNPADLNPGISSTLANIVLKLLAKNAEARYQSLGALRRDLERYRAALEAGEPNCSFAAGDDDYPARFRLPQRLYGRGVEQRLLLEAYHQARLRQTTVALVAGAAGVGKSALVREALQPLVNEGALLGSGKFEQYEDAVPYRAVGLALDGLLQQLVSEEGDALQGWRVATARALANTGGALLDLAPALEQAIGPQAPPPPLPANEARARLEHALEGALRAMVSLERPVCVVLDDLQWAGNDSLRLIQSLILSSQSLRILFVLAYREHAVERLSPLVAALESSSIPVTRLALQPLDRAACAAMVGDTIPQLAPYEERLGDAVWSRTGGNPFFIRAFIGALNADGVFDSSEHGPREWLDIIERRGVTDNVVELLTDRIDRLPDPTRQLLGIAACLGSQFNLQTLKAVTPPGLIVHLWPALAAELLQPLEPLQSSSDLLDDLPRRDCRFAHDRIQQAAMSMLTPTERSAIHFQIGSRLLEDAPAINATLELQAASHLNQALDLILDGSQRVRLAHLNLQASGEALRRGAPVEALGLAQAGSKALENNAWQREYEVVRDLHLAVGTAAFSVPDYETLGQAVQAVISHARSPIDLALMKRLEGQAHHAQLRIPEAFATYTQALAALGVAIPTDPTPAEAGEELRLTAEAMRSRPFEDLLGMEPCSDREVALAMDILDRFTLLAYATTSRLLPVLVCRLVRLSIEHGTTPQSATGFTFYGVLLSGDHALDRAYRCGRLAIDLAHRFDDRRALSQTYLYANYQLLHWKEPLRELARAFGSAHQYAVEAGDPLNTACSATTMCICRFWGGDNLAQLATDMREYRESIVRLRQDLILNWHEILLQTVSNLHAPSHNPTELLGPFYDERARLPIHQSIGDHSALFNYHVSRMFLCYLFGDYAGAISSADQVQSWMAIYGTAFWAVPVVWLDSLCRLAVYESSSVDDRLVADKQLDTNMEKLKTWLPHNRTVLEPKLRLLEAELARVHGDRLRAEVLYVQATELIKTLDVPHEEGMVCELAGRFFALGADAGRARTLMRTAHRAYLRWGARTKAISLENNHPLLLPRQLTAPEQPGEESGPIPSFDALDLLSVLHMTRSISSEVRPGPLMQRLMGTLLENGGAQSGYLILQKDGSWVIEAGRHIERGATTILESIPVEEASGHAHLGIAASVVMHVARTGTVVVLDDAAAIGAFARDPHIRQHRVRSVLCFPLQRQGKIRAIAYLENAAATGAFTANSVRTLELLSTQATISLENATLYQSLEQKVAARTQELSDKNSELARALQRLQAMQEQLVTQEKLAALGALTAGIAHEIKNPLNFVVNLAEVERHLAGELAVRLRSQFSSMDRGLRTDLEDLLGDIEQTARKIGEHGERANAIVSGMARHAGRGGGEKEAVELNDLVAQSILLAHGDPELANASSVAVVAQYDETLGPVQAVLQDLSRVFVNLINNALYSVLLKAAHNAGFFPTISVRTLDVGNHVEIRIRDNGVGIPANLRERIFLPFFTTKPPGLGSGLGLSLSQDIVVRGHQGDIQLESVEGGFAEFVVSLPKHV